LINFSETYHIEILFYPAFLFIYPAKINFAQKKKKKNKKKEKEQKEKKQFPPSLHCPSLSQV